MKLFACMGFAFLLAACAHQSDQQTFDRPALLDQLADAQRLGVVRADRHILVVRHARKSSPECNAMDCQLSPRGEAMVSRLHGLVGPAPFDAAYASAACRTRDTARAGGIKVQSHRAADRLSRGCEAGESIDRLRSDAYADARSNEKRWTIVAEHSNTVCQWLAEFVPDDTAREAAGCQGGRLPSSAYGVVYWLYRTDGQWHLTHLDNAFDVAPQQTP